MILIKSLDIVISVHSDAFIPLESISAFTCFEKLKICKDKELHSH